MGYICPETQDNENSIKYISLLYIFKILFFIYTLLLFLLKYLKTRDFFLVETDQLNITVEFLVLHGTPSPHVTRLVTQTTLPLLLLTITSSISAVLPLRPTSTPATCGSSTSKSEHRSTSTTPTSTTSSTASNINLIEPLEVSTLVVCVSWLGAAVELPSLVSSLLLDFPPGCWLAAVTVERRLLLLLTQHHLV